MIVYTPNMYELVKEIHGDLQEYRAHSAVFGTASLKMIYGNKFSNDPDDVDFLISRTIKKTLTMTALGRFSPRLDTSRHPIFDSHWVITFYRDDVHLGDLVSQYGIKISQDHSVIFSYDHEDGKISLYLQSRGIQTNLGKHIYSENTIPDRDNPNLKIAPPKITLAKIILEAKMGRNNSEKLSAIRRHPELKKLLKQAQEQIVGPILASC